MSDVWVQKMKTYFRKFDLDKDGIIGREDFERLPDAAQRLRGLGKIDPTAMEKIRREFSDLYSIYMRGAGATDDISLTEDLFIESMKNVRDDPDFRKVINDSVHTVYSLIDVNEDGFLSYEEFDRFYQSLGLVDAAFTKEAFESLDANNDGKISFEEFADVATKYMYSDEEGSTVALGLLP